MQQGFRIYHNIYRKQLNVEDALDVAAYPADGSYIDVSRFERFAFTIMAGALDSEIVAQVYQDTGATETADVKVVTGATKTIGATGDDKTYIIEVETNQLDMNNDFRYVTLKLTGAAGSNDYGAILFEGINPDEVPVTQPSTVATGVFVGG